MGEKGWAKGLRRAAAFFMATVTLWILSLTADFSGAAEAVRLLGESPAFVTAALAAELNYDLPEDEPELLGRWGKLAVEQSPLLSAGAEGVARALKEMEAADRAEPDDPHDPVQLPVVTSSTSTAATTI